MIIIFIILIIVWKKDILNYLNDDKGFITLNDIYIYNANIFNYKLKIIKDIFRIKLQKFGMDPDMVPSFIPRYVCVKSEDYKDEIKNADLKPSAFDNEDEMNSYMYKLRLLIYEELSKCGLLKKCD